MAVGFTRREALCGGCAWGVVACSGDTTDGMFFPPPETSDSTPLPDTGEPTGTDLLPCDDVSVQPGAPGWVSFPIASYPDLAIVGGWYAVTAGGRSIIVACVETDCYVAIDRPCAHEGEPINYVASRGPYGQFVCPRHGAVYAIDGSKVSGPQLTGLPTYAAGLSGDAVWVNAG
jgi:nitrite reductase/ring-hydroxylating ferredoxin subunit